MPFESKSGTHGARQPSGPFFRLLNRVVTRRVRKGKGGPGGFDMLILHTVGAKSGEPRINPLGWFADEDDSYLVVASAMGAPKNPAWYHNIASRPDEVSVEINGRTIAVTPDQLHGAERDRAWAQISQASSQFAGYQNKTDRQIPIIRLTPRS